MRYTASGSLQLLHCFAVLLFAAVLTAGSASATGKSPDDLDIITVSTRPDTVSGGDVLVRITAPPSVAINDLVIVLNGQAVTSASILRLADILCSVWSRVLKSEKIFWWRRQ
jgi:hypothetical protein